MHNERPDVNKLYDIFEETHFRILAVSLRQKQTHSKSINHRSILESGLPRTFLFRKQVLCQQNLKFIT